MELDDLRRQWQQPLAEVPATMNSSTLGQLLSRNSRSPVSKMRRNAWLEIGFGIACFLIGCIALFYIDDAYVRSMLAWLLTVCLLNGLYLRRKLEILRGLEDANGALREHIVRQLYNIRELMKLYYQLTKWASIVSFGIGMFFQASSIIHKSASLNWTKPLCFLVACYLVLGIGTFFLMHGLTRSYLQRLYGRHLDRLEASLAELDEPTAAAAAR